MNRIVFITVVLVLLSLSALAGEKEDLALQGSRILQEDRALTDEARFLDSLLQSTLSQIETRRRAVEQRKQELGKQFEAIRERLGKLNQPAPATPESTQPKKEKEKKP